MELMVIVLIISVWQLAAHIKYLSRAIPYVYGIIQYFFCRQARAIELSMIMHNHNSLSIIGTCITLQHQYSMQVLYTVICRNNLLTIYALSNEVISRIIYTVDTSNWHMH